MLKNGNHGKPGACLVRIAMNMSTAAINEPWPTEAPTEPGTTENPTSSCFATVTNNNL